MGVNVSIDAGEVLRHAWRVVWKHRALWLVNALPLVPFLVLLPLLVFVFLSDVSMSDLPNLLNNPTFLVLLFSVLAAMAGASFVLQVFSRAAATFGILQLESGAVSPSFRTLWQGGRRFFWQILGTMLLASAGITIVSMFLSAFVALVGAATLGLGSAIGQIVILPITLLLYAIAEQAQVAVIANALSPVSAIRRAWELVQEHIESFAALTIILYVILSIAGGVATLPVAAPLFLAVLSRFAGHSVDPSLFSIAMWMFVTLLPVYLLFQALSLLYRRAVHVVIYLRCTRGSNLQPLPRIGEASS
jgi:hypothetical protein